MAQAQGTMRGLESIRRSLILRWGAVIDTANACEGRGIQRLAHYRQRRCGRAEQQREQREAGDEAALCVK